MNRLTDHWRQTKQRKESKPQSTFSGTNSKNEKKDKRKISKIKYVKVNKSSHPLKTNASNETFNLCDSLTDVVLAELDLENTEFGISMAKNLFSASDKSADEKCLPEKNSTSPLQDFQNSIRNRIPGNVKRRSLENITDNRYHGGEKASCVNGKNCSVKNTTNLSKEINEAGCDNVMDIPGNNVPNVSRNIEEDQNTSGYKVPECSLDAWDLPECVLQQYARQGVSQMFQWQAECLLKGKALEGGNLVYSAPTSAGKTLVAELLILKRVLETKKKAIFILPFVSVAREKMTYLQGLFQDAGLRVDGYMGNHNPAGGFSAVDVAVCTIEKANGLMNRLMEEGKLHCIGIMVVDEMHMLGDPHRGYLLELLLTKVLYISKKLSTDPETNIQIVGMSATLPNLSTLSNWLQADLYHTSYRPVPLTEYCKIGNLLYNTATMKVSREVKECLKLTGISDQDQCVYLAVETLTSGHSVLIFCPSKQWCEQLATSIAKAIYEMGRPRAHQEPCLSKLEESLGEKLREELQERPLRDVLEQLRRCPAGLDGTLANTVPMGVAFHHAGLTMDERDIVESAFRQSNLRVLVATSTLSSGVNLPARRVIVRSPLAFGSILDVLSYKQMVGRAGRMGVDTEGESILICKETERHQAMKLVSAQLNPVQSCLMKQGDKSLSSSLKRAILEVVASGVASSPEDLSLYASCTLLAASLREETTDQSNRDNAIKICVNYLIDNEFIYLVETPVEEGLTTTKYIPTQLGKAVLASSLTPDEGLNVLKELSKAQKCFVLDSELHLVYQVTPPYVSSQLGSLDWLHYLSIWELLPASLKRVGELVGVEERFLARAVRTAPSGNSARQANQLAVHQRFYAALALHDLVQERPLPSVSNKYSLPKGLLQSLQQSAATFSGMVTAFCGRLGWCSMELLVSQFQSRLHFGVQQELCDLVSLHTVDGQRARCLHDAGYETVALLAAANHREVEIALKNSGPFRSCKVSTTESEGTLAPRSIFIPGYRGMTCTEAAELIVRDAQYRVQKSLGINFVRWGGTPSDLNGDQEQPNLVEANVKEPERSNLPSKSNEIPIGNKPAVILERDRSIINTMVQNNEGQLPAITSGNEFSISESSENYNFPSKSNEIPIQEHPVALIQSLPNTIHEVFDKNQNPLIKCSDISKLYDILTDGNFDSTVDKPILPAICMDPVTILPKIVLSSNHNEQHSLPGVSNIELERYAEKHQSSFTLGMSRTSTCSPELICHKIPKELNGVNKSSGLLKPEAILAPNSVPYEDDSDEVICLDDSIDFNAFCQRRKSTKERRLQFSVKTFSRVVSRIGELQSRSGNAISNAVVLQALKNCTELSKQKSKSPIEKVSTLHDSTGFKNPNVIIPRKSSEYSPFPQSEDLFPDSEQQASPILRVPVSVKTPTIAISPSSQDLFDSLDEDSDYLNQAMCDKDSASKSNLLSNDSSTGIRVNNISRLDLNKAFDFHSPFTCSTSIGNSRTSFIPVEQCAKPKNSNERVSFELSESAMLAINNMSAMDSSRLSACTSVKPDLQNRENFNRTTFNDLFAKSVLFTPTPQKRKSSESSSSSDLLSPTLPKLSRSKFSLCRYKDSDTEPTQGFTKLKSRNKEMESVSSAVASTNGAFTIIDVAASRELFQTFMLELQCQKKIAISLACGRKRIPEAFKGIGASIKADKPISKQPILKEDLDICVDDRTILGLSFCWEGRDSYFLSLTATDEPEDNMREGEDLIPPHQDPLLSLQDRLNAVQEILNNSSRSKTLVTFDLKQQLHLLSRGCGLILRPQPWLDPKVADWLLDPGGKEKTLHSLVVKHIPDYTDLLDAIGGTFGFQSIGITTSNKSSGRIRASTEAVLTFHLIDQLMLRLQDVQLDKIFLEVEMPTIVIICQMEENGFGFSQEVASRLQSSLQSHLVTLQANAHRMAGRTFNLASCQDVSKVLYKELQLIPPNGVTTFAGGARSKQRAVTSTSKGVLEKLKSQHPLPALIQEWRKVSCSLTKVLLPLLRESQFCSSVKMSRVFGECLMSTVTGRISMREPSLQNVPKEFPVTSAVSRNTAKTVSLRDAFVPFKGAVLLSADYSQLELRILAHLTNDPSLLSSLNSGVDVFTCIAAQWQHISSNEVSQQQRQRAKQICYGMIYGIGHRALADQLEVEESEAAQFMDSFQETYPGIRKFMQSVVESCRTRGFVETLLGRRRYLPNILSNNGQQRSSAERQAINTKVQGSAADLVKKAMLSIQGKLYCAFPDCAKTHRAPGNIVSKGAYFVLQLHDELLYEVSDLCLRSVAEIVKDSMENVAPEGILLPVNLSSGPSWGQLSNLTL